MAIICHFYDHNLILLLQRQDFSVVTSLMLHEGGKYLKRCENAGAKISKLGVPFVFDGAVSSNFVIYVKHKFIIICGHFQRIMVHSHSRVVLETLHAVPENIYFTVYLVTSKEDDYKGKMLHDRVNIEYIRISDSEVGTRMENVDLVFVGAEAVVKNGGIINKVNKLRVAF